MNDVPPSRDPPEDLDEHYRRVSGLDPSRPSESVRRTVLMHAAQLAAERRAKIDSTRPAANRAGWRSALFGTLAAAALAGLLMTPQFLGPRTPSVAAPPAPPCATPCAASAGQSACATCRRYSGNACSGRSAVAGTGANVERGKAAATARRQLRCGTRQRRAKCIA